MLSFFQCYPFFSFHTRPFLDTPSSAEYSEGRGEQDQNGAHTCVRDERDGEREREEKGNLRFSVFALAGLGLVA